MQPSPSNDPLKDDTEPREDCPCVRCGKVRLTRLRDFNHTTGVETVRICDECFELPPINKRG